MWLWFRLHLKPQLQVGAIRWTGRQTIIGLVLLCGRERLLVNSNDWKRTLEREIVDKAASSFDPPRSSSLPSQCLVNFASPQEAITSPSSWFGNKLCLGNSPFLTVKLDRIIHFAFNQPRSA